MTFVRKDIYALGTPWNDTLVWYAKGVTALQKQPINLKASWRYLAAMHGFDRGLWTRFGYLGASEALPSQAEQQRYWNQCQHQSWFFLPWHRSYVLCFEAMVRAAIVAQKGPADWALPYWNYSATATDELKIHPAFLAKSLPDGTKNPLYVEARLGKAVQAGDADLSGRLDDPEFQGSDDGSGEGVGGPRTLFSHSGSAEGLIEAKPHDLVHVDVGGRGGLMSDPRTAALDPIFWVHHANIDRLWEVWRQRNPADKNPSDPQWLNGPADRAFATFGADGKDVPSAPKDVVDTAALGYKYDDVSDPLGGRTRRDLRMAALAAKAPREPAAVGAVTRGSKVEILGSSAAGARLGAAAVTLQVKLASDPAARVHQSFAAGQSAAAAEPDRVFLNLEDIRGDNGAAVFDVYVGEKGATEASAQNHVGAFSLFGLESASDRAAPHGGRGLKKVIEITRVIDQFQQSGKKLPGVLEVRIVPRGDVRDDDHISVGQATLVRRGH
jgi:tyrosinase